jgi:plasmid maintenance system killer protein
MWRKLIDDSRAGLDKLLLIEVCSTIHAIAAAPSWFRKENLYPHGNKFWSLRKKWRFILRFQFIMK